MEHTLEEPKVLDAAAVVHTAVAVRTAEAAGHIAEAGHTVGAVHIAEVPLERMSSGTAKKPAPVAPSIACRTT